MAQQQRQHYGHQTDEYGNQIHESEEQRTAGYGGEHGTTGGGYRGTQYGTTDIGGGTAGYGGGHGTTGGGYSGSQYGTTDIEGGGGHEAAGGGHKITDVGGGGHGAVVGGYSTTGGGATHGTTGTGTGLGLDRGSNFGGPGADLGLGGTGDDLGLARHRGLDRQQGPTMGGKGHDDHPMVTTTTTTIATGVSYEHEAEDNEEKKGMIDKILDKVPGLP